MTSIVRLLVLSAALLAIDAVAVEGKIPPQTAAGNKAPPAPAAVAVNADGTWHLEVQTARGTGTPKFTFKQEGESLTGHYSGLFGEAPVTGTLKGSEIRFSLKVGPGGKEMTITYAGTVEGDTMKGKASFGAMGEGTFTGKRQAN